MLGGIASGGALGYAVGGALYGFAVKSGWVQKLPAIPIVGRTGTAAILLDYLARRGIGGDMTRKAASAAAVLAGYQLGSTGVITGDANSDLSLGEEFHTGEDGYGDYE